MSKERNAADEEMIFDHPRIYMVFAPNFLTRGAVPYGTPSGDPNKAIRSAVIRNFGDNGCTFHQIQAMWRFLHSKGFDCKRVSMMQVENYEPNWFDKELLT